VLSTTLKTAAAMLVASAFIARPQGDAQARIVCDGNYQIVNGLPVGTPYCRELNLARVAQGYGMRVSVEAIRFSESARSQVCRAIGNDNRVQEICAPYRPDGGTRVR
jgi:hypothetical protein